MFSAILFAVSVVALAQFTLYYWRAIIAAVAAQPIPNEVLEAAHLREATLCGADFERLTSLLNLTPELKRNRARLGLVPAYFKTVGKISEVFGSLSPTVASWSEHERIVCARFAAVQVGRRLEENFAQAASMRSC
jgi:hypothetical protein